MTAEEDGTSAGHEGEERVKENKGKPTTCRRSCPDVVSNLEVLSFKLKQKARLLFFPLLKTQSVDRAIARPALDILP